MNFKIICHLNILNKKYDLWANIMRKISYILSINFTFFKLETQNQNIRSSTITVLGTSTKHFIYLYIYIYFFLNDVDLQLIVEFRNCFGKYHQVCPKKH